MKTIDVISQQMKEFEKRVNELRQSIPEDDMDGPILEFGYKTLRHGGKEVFTVTDWGNIKSFLHSSFLALLESIGEEAEGMKKTHRLTNEYGDNTPMSPEDVIYDYALSDIKSHLSEMKKGLG